LLAISLLAGMVPSGVSFAQAPTVDSSETAQLQAADRVNAETSCAEAHPLAVNETVQQSLSSRGHPPQWIQFHVQKDARYRLAIGNGAGIQAFVYDHCQTDGPALLMQNGAVEFTATRDGHYYLLMQQPEGAITAAATVSVTFEPAAPHRASFVQVDGVPQAVVRRATEFLEELRGGDLAPEWSDARVNPNARILYRPDIQGPAYYEFTVEKPEATGSYTPAGFIQLGVGDHDYPVTHWDVTGMSPTQELEELAPLGQKLTQFYKVDALAYAAEYETMTRLGLSVLADDVISLGQLPGRIKGLETIPQEAAELVTTGVDSDNNTTHEGPEELPLTEQEGWDSWAALKQEYDQEYGPLLDSLKNRAEESWTLENGIRQHGESLVQGDVRTVHGLLGHTIESITVTGEGSATQYLQQEQLATNNVPTGLRLTVLDEPANEEDRLPIEVTLAYTSGTTETVKYAIVNSEALNINTLYLPAVSANNSSNSSTVRSTESSAATGAWGPWSYWWASGDAGAIRYGQMSSGSAPNNSSCASGCGGTSWAMLFAWVDQRAAAGASPWTNHWGLYRTNGGLGANATAPNTQDEGVRNMTWEIRNHIGTFCILGSGATWPWNMINAANYVRPRASAAWSMQTKYDPTGLCWFGACNGNRNLAIDAIVNRRQPVVVGTGWLEHYPLAYGYAERSQRSCFLFWCSTEYSRWFWVNNGWYGNNNGWTSADVWFAGTYYP
jgi:hypothetical protein